MTDDYPLGITRFELREIAGHPQVWEELDDILVTERRLVDYPDWVIRSRFYVGTRVPILVGLTVEPASLYPWPPKTPLTPKVLRTIGTTDLIRSARSTLEASKVIGLAVDAEAYEFRVNPRPGRARRPDIFYARIAARYVDLVPNGSPTKALAEEMNVSQPQARDLIHEARTRKLLTPTQRGQAGGELTPKALNTLAGHRTGA